MNDIEEIRAILYKWDSYLTTKQKHYIHFFSMRNFVIHFTEISNEKFREKIVTTMKAYIEEVEFANRNYKGVQSFELAQKYLTGISEYYKDFAGFRIFLRLKFVVIISLIGDLFLYFFSSLADVSFLPIVSIIFFTYYFYILFTYYKKNRVYGIFY